MSELFPYPTIRPGQDRFMQDTATALAERKILLANAPTGLGKTASVLSAAVQAALEKKKVVFFVTNRHTQHRIAIETLQKINEKSAEKILCADLIGKRWMCSQDVAGLFGSDFNEYCRTIVEKDECSYYSKVHGPKELQVETKLLLEQLQKRGPLHNEELVARSKEQGCCSYEVALALAKKAKVIIGDYNYVFNPFVQAALFTKIDRKLEQIILIVDEGHNLPRRVAEMLSQQLSNFMLRNALIEAQKFHYGGLAGWMQELLRILQELARFEPNTTEKLVERAELMDRIRPVVDYDQLCQELELAAEEVRKKQRKSYLGGIAAFLQAWAGEDKGFTRIISEKIGKYGPQTILSYSCLDPALITRDVFSQVQAGIIMSGTLQPLSMYRDLLGIDRYLEKEYLSPFPPENKLSLIVPETSTKYAMRSDAMYQAIAEKSSELARLIPGNVALFFPSYAFRDQVGSYFRSEKKLFWEKSEMSKEEKELFLEEFRAEKERGGVLLGVTGANFAEGIDLPGDLLNGVVIIGLPLSQPDLHTKETIRYYQEKFGRGWDYGYVFPAITKCLQSAGRCIRSEKDKGVVVYLDERFAWPRYYNLFSDRVGLIVTRNYAKFIEEFFGNPAKS